MKGIRPARPDIAVAGHEGLAACLRGLLAGFCLPLFGCAQPGPVTTAAPEAVLPACEAGALSELRRADPTVTGVSLEPLDSARVERRTPASGEDGVTLVIDGHGRAQGGAAGTFRYTCLVGTKGVLFVVVEPQGAGQVMAECADQPGGPRSCLRGLLASAEAALAKAEGSAIAVARRRGGKRAEVDEPAAESIGAWRVYRDAECARRWPSDEARETACQVELTRGRIAELRD